MLKKLFKRLLLAFALLVVGLSMAIILLPSSVSPAPEVTAVFHPDEAAFGEERSLNILLLGVDYNYDSKAQRYTSGARSDTILILRVERKGKQLSMLSIPRDLFVGIGKNAVHGYERINAAYSFGGEKLTIETLERVTGVKIDHYIVVKSDVVADMVDAIGGVPVEVEKQMDWDDNWAGLHIHLKPGKQVLNGEQAVGYCRFRHDEEGDFGRIKRQQKFLTALMKELKQKKSFKTYQKLAGLVRAKMKTDLENKQLVGLAMLYKNFPLDNIRKGRPEVLDYFENGAAYLVLAPGEPDQTVTMSAPTGSAPNVTNFSGYLPPGPYGEAIVPTGATLSLLEGANYQFERIQLDGTATLAIGNGSLPALLNPATSRTVVQVNDTIVMANSARIINASERADYLEFEINGVSGGTNSISGGFTGGNPSLAYFVMKAPTSRVELLEGHVYGAVVARVIEVGIASDCRVAFDLDLPNNTSSPILPGGTGEVNLFVISYQIF